MKHIYGLIILVAAAGQTAAAGARLDLSARMLIQNSGQVALGYDAALFDPRVAQTYSRAGNEGDGGIGVIVKLNHGYTAEDVAVAVEGVTVTSAIDDMAILSLPVEALEALAACPAVQEVSAGEPRTPGMYFARSVCKVDQVQGGSDDLPQPYTGKGIVVGCMDQGLDPNHINFSDGTDYTTTRVKAVYVYGSNNGKITRQATTPDEISAFTTDVEGASHGTHVMGIAAGSYNGPSNYGLSSQAYTNSPMPYYGVATEADIVMTGGNFYDANILNGVEKVITYAENEGKPAVVNLSLGSVLGSHDGRDATCQYLAKLGERGIICIAAGNDGASEIAMSMSGGRSASQRSNNAVTFEMGTAETSPYVIQYWASGSEEFTCDFVVYSTDSKSVVYSLPIPNLEGKSVAVGGSSMSSAYQKNTNFSAAFSATSYAAFWSQVQNGRYMIQMQCLLNRDGTSDYSLQPAIRVTRASGQSVYGYLFSSNNSGKFKVESGTGWNELNWSNTVPSTDGTISDMATAENVVSVGAFTSSASFSILNGASYSFQDRTGAGQMCKFSSYGSNPLTGETYPYICAPGSAIVSSVSNYDKSATQQVSGSAGGNGRANYWTAMQGTSMACPFVTGTVALWLQANPDMTIQDVLSVIKTTAVRYTGGDSQLKAQWGNGKIDALAGIKEVLARKNAGVDGVMADGGEGWVVTPAGYRTYCVTVEGADAVTATLYDLQGRAVAEANGLGGEVTLDASHAAGGVYVMAVDGANRARLSRKVVIK